MSKRIIIHICSKDRATEVGLLLQSLRTQTFQDFNIVILDDASKVPLTNFYFIQYLAQRLKLEGHNITILRNETSAGVSGARQQLVDWSMKNGNEELICRIDDDSVSKEDFLKKMVEGIDTGYDLMGCIVPNVVGPDVKRDIRFVEPVIGECRLDKKGKLIINQDDCGYMYAEEKILPTHHFRSSCLYKRAIHEAGVDYNSRLSKHGFREEQIFSFKAIIAGFKLGVHTGAINYHLMTPSGGERSTTNMTQFNQNIFEETTKRMFEDNGDFLADYLKKLGVKPKKYSKDELKKGTNLVY